MSPALASAVPAMVDSFVQLALLTAMADGAHTPESVADWALEVLPAAVRNEVSRAELVARAAQLLGSEVTEEVTREPRH